MGKKALKRLIRKEVERQLQAESPKYRPVGFNDYGSAPHVESSEWQLWLDKRKKNG